MLLHLLHLLLLLVIQDRLRLVIRVVGDHRLEVVLLLGHRLIDHGGDSHLLLGWERAL